VSGQVCQSDEVKDKWREETYDKSKTAKGFEKRKTQLVACRPLRFNREKTHPVVKAPNNPAALASPKFSKIKLR